MSRANRGYRRWEKELDLNVLDCGALQIIQEESQMPELKKRYEVALRNDVEGAKDTDAGGDQER